MSPSLFELTKRVFEPPLGFRRHVGSVFVLAFPKEFLEQGFGLLKPCRTRDRSGSRLSNRGVRTDNGQATLRGFTTRLGERRFEVLRVVWLFAGGPEPKRSSDEQRHGDRPPCDDRSTVCPRPHAFCRYRIG